MPHWVVGKVDSLQFPSSLGIQYPGTFFHLAPKYEDTHVMMNLSIYNANLDIINISPTLFRITQHIPSVQQQETLERLAALPPVPIKKITLELMGEVLQETLSSDKSFWLRPSFLMGCIRFVVSIMSTVACIMKKKVAAWKPPALTGFLSLCRKDKNNTKMDDEDMDGPIYRPSGIILTVKKTTREPWHVFYSPTSVKERSP